MRANYTGASILGHAGAWPYHPQRTVGSCSRTTAIAVAALLTARERCGPPLEMGRLLRRTAEQALLLQSLPHLARFVLMC
jgi:hypothetical protein